MAEEKIILEAHPSHPLDKVLTETFDNLGQLNSWLMYHSYGIDIEKTRAWYSKSKKPIELIEKTLNR